MINLKKITFRLIATIGISMVVACSSQNDIIEDISQPDDSNQPHTCKMILEGTMSGFDDEPQSRSAASWTNGDKIYLTFTVGNSKSYGDAIYNNGAWTVNYYGSLTQNTESKCSAVYFENSESESGSVIHISENTAIYEDSIGSYIFSGGSLSVIANLKPKTGRIRFAGNGNDKITLYGITHFTSYDYSTGRYTNSISALQSKVTLGYTPYIYGIFSDSEQPRLNMITASSGFTHLPSTTIYQPGESGFMTIPTENSHNGWQNTVIFKVKGVEFTMIPVTYSSGNFLLAETETTEQLYNAVVGNTLSDSQIPKSGLSSSSWETFISQISAITELDFRKPTETEWKYAAKGGSKSRGYSYSGSNIISNVAWYSANSNNKAHPVKQLQPNELGFYDMSGNLMEITQSSDYSWYGGGYNNSATGCTVTSSYSSSYSQSTGGLRLALSNN